MQMSELLCVLYQIDRICIRGSRDNAKHTNKAAPTVAPPARVGAQLHTQKSSAQFYVVAM
jgi:hypothetical protein